MSPNGIPPGGAGGPQDQMNRYRRGGGGIPPQGSIPPGGPMAAGGPPMPTGGPGGMAGPQSGSIGPLQSSDSGAGHSPQPGGGDASYGNAIEALQPDGGGMSNSGISPQPPQGAKMPPPWQQQPPQGGMAPQGGGPRPMYQGAPGAGQRSQMAGPQGPGTPQGMQPGQQGKKLNTF